MYSNKKSKILRAAKSPLALAITAVIGATSAQSVFAFGDGAMCSPTSTFTVTSSLGDTSTGTLGEALSLANADADCSQIEFASDVGNITLAQTTTISEALNIVGHGKDTLTLSSTTGNTLHATRGNLHVSHLSIKNSPSAAIYQQFANLTVDDVLLDNNGQGIFADDAYDTAVLNSTITNSGFDSGIKFYNNATGSSLLIDKSDINNNAASGGGGGLFAQVLSGGEIKISDSTFSGNTTFGSGGGINIQFGEYGPFAIDIERSTISGNSADQAGGGIYISNSGDAEMTIENSTISGNTANSYGGGMKIDDSIKKMPVYIKSSNIVKNIARFSGCGIDHDGNNDGISISNSVIALNTSSASNSGKVNLDGVFNSLDYSWIGDNSSYDGDGALINETLANFTNAPTNSVVEGDQTTLNLGDLADNGGPTYTHKPQTNSPLLAAGAPNPVNLATNDQRGSTREVGTLDIGAVEVNATPIIDTSQVVGEIALDLGENVNINLSAIHTDSSATIEVTGLPSGLIFNAQTAIISGVSQETGAIELGITVSNFDESASDTLDLYVKLPAPVVDTSSIIDALSVTTGEEININISAINNDENVTFAVSGLPSGLSYETQTQSITGTTALGGVSPLVITVSNIDYTTTANVNLNIETQIPVLDSASILSHLNITAEQTVSIDISAVASSEVTLAVSGLPSGLVFDPSTSIISGTTTQSGTFELNITATQFDASASIEVNLVVQEQASGSSSSNGLGSFSYGWLLMLAGIFARRRR